MFRKFILISFVLFGIVGLNNAIAQYDFHNTEYKVHTIYIYNFTRYITWPNEYNTGNFVIGVVGETKLVNELKKMASVKSVGGRRIEVQKYNSLNEVDKHCHIMILPRSSSDLLSNVIRQNSRGTLIITQKPGLAKVGSLVNFVSVAGKPKFELNMQAVDRSGLRVATPLRTIAITI